MPTFKEVDNGRIAHGYLMSFVVILLFPLGGALLRLFSIHGVRIHMAWQIFGLATLVAGFGLGLWIQKEMYIEWTDPHQALGASLFALFLCMPLLGIFNHWRFRKTGEKTIVGYVHLWVGRALLIIGLVEGGLGIRLADEEGKGKHAYIALAALSAFFYMVMLVWWYFKGRNNAKKPGMERTTQMEMAPSPRRSTGREV